MPDWLYNAMNNHPLGLAAIVLAALLIFGPESLKGKLYALLSGLGSLRKKTPVAPAVAANGTLDSLIESQNALISAGRMDDAEAVLKVIAHVVKDATPVPQPVPVAEPTA